MVSMLVLVDVLLAGLVQVLMETHMDIYHNK